MKMYKNDSACEVDREQVAAMLESGWSIESEVPVVEPVPEVEAEVKPEPVAKLNLDDPPKVVKRKNFTRSE